MQSLKGAVQAETEHCVPIHAGVPFAAVHWVLHAPQLFTLLVVAVSQPLATFPSQFWNPGEHAIPHCPAEHEGVPCTLLQILLQLPQELTLISVLVSHPFATLPSQSANGAVQDAIWQLPEEQDATAFGKLQVVPQVTQF